MPADSLSELSSQAFRTHATAGSPSDSEITLIESLFDSKAGQHVVRWKDIQRVFENAKYIKEDGVVILPMTDNGLEDLLPLRFRHRPGVVLEVFLWTSQLADSTSLASISHADSSIPLFESSSNATARSGEPGIQESALITGGDKNGIVEEYVAPKEVEDLSIAEIGDADDTNDTNDTDGTDDANWACHPTLASAPEESPVLILSTETTAMDQRFKFLTVDMADTKNNMLLLSTSLNAIDRANVPHSSVITPKAQSSLQAYDQLHNSYFQAIMSGQMNQATSIKEAMSEHFGNLQVEMDKNKELQKQMLELQQQSLEKQKQALDRLAIIQNRVQTVINQTYELHEYPIPRLFIVLPKATRRRERLGKIFSRQFRLFFLCECGAHTMREGSKVQHKIHLAKHEGYDLEKPTEFFAKYGPYVLAMMQMVRYGFTVAEFIVPALAHTGLVEGIDAVQQGLDFAQSNIGSLVEDTINFIQGQQGRANGGMSLEGGDQTDVDNLQVLEGADLRQLQGYLNVSDKGRVLGNLYRIVTPEGHVKWVCIDHYRENYRESSTLQLRDLVNANSGTFIEEKGRIEVTFATSVRAKQFYDVMTKARGIQELAITLQWDVTLDDLRTLAAAVNKANVVYLIMDGSSFKGGPTLDFINRGRRFDPILELMSNARIQCMRLLKFEEFCLRVSSSSITMAPQLRLLSIDLSVSLYEKTAQVIFSRILENCPSLSELRVESYHQQLVLQLITEKMDHFKALETLAITCNGRSITVRFSRGKIHAMVLSIQALVNLSEDELKYCAMGRLKKLEIGITPAAADEERLVEILQQNLGLEEIVIGCDVERLPAIVKLIASTRGQLVLQGRAVALRQLEVVKNRGISQADLGKNENVKTVVRFDDSSSVLSISSVIDLSGSKDSECLTRVSELFRDYAWTVERLITNSMFDDRLAGLLDQVTAEKGSRLKYLELFPRSVTSAGVESIDRVIERSQDLEGLRIQFHGLRDELQQEKAERMLHQHGQRLTALLLNGSAAEVWISRLAKTCPTRHDLPEMQDFRILCVGKQKISQGCAQWIADMVAGPSNDTVVLLPSQATSQNELEVQTPKPPTQTELSETWRPLKEIYLVCLVIQPEEWKTMIRAIDFTGLELLQVSNTNFSFEEFKLMVDCISDKARVNIPLMTLNVERTALSKGEDTSALRELIARLKKKAPLVKILGV